MALKSWVYLTLVMGLVAGCQLGTTGDAVTTEPLVDAAEGVANPAPPATSVRLVDRDVEAPQDFQVTDKGLWDGRPSLGGVWVAATSVRDPMRVIMRNPANGKFVIGALFRREADNPGPKLQISSDAADALGLVAGEPATLNVTALRREEAPVQVPDATKPLLDTPETLAGADVASAADPAITAAPIAAQPSEPLAIQPAAELPPPAKPAASAPAAAGGTQIQIGIFSVEDNANRAVTTLAESGITATVRKETSLGKPLFSVVASGNAAILAQIKQAGFKDAYFITR
ncbi:MAG: SPOR domain-containing protein [Candidatus Saccharibacteria bacterium]|nr:SPOR domain-containing protein [Pseudorhodobacter sp.]